MVKVQQLLLQCHFNSLGFFAGEHIVELKDFLMLQWGVWRFALTTHFINLQLSPAVTSLHSFIGFPSSRYVLLDWFATTTVAQEKEQVVL